MNPLGWAKAIYETFGTPYPRVSLIVVMVACAALGALAWLFLSKQVENDRLKSSSPSNVSGPASTSGDSSPANTGNGNDFRYDQSSTPKDQNTPKKKE
jgi:hypothetical protein